MLAARLLHKSQISADSSAINWPVNRVPWLRGAVSGDLVTLGAGSLTALSYSALAYSPLLHYSSSPQALDWDDWCVVMVFHKHRKVSPCHQLVFYLTLYSLKQ